MDAEVTIKIEAVDDKEIIRILQAVRTLEQTNPKHMLMRVTVNAPNLTKREANALLDQIRPSFRYRTEL